MKTILEIGDEVLVTVKPDDIATHDFTGHIVSFNRGYVQVQDQEEHVWDFDRDQLTPTTA